MCKNCIGCNIEKNVDFSHQTKHPDLCVGVCGCVGCVWGVWGVCVCVCVKNDQIKYNSILKGCKETLVLLI